jgi:hypothetical protein
MAYKIKVKRGRHEVKYKERTFDGFAPKGFEFHKVSTKKKAVIFKRKE